MPRPTAASRVMPTDWSTRPSSSIATQRLVKSPSSPAPPYSSGAVSPKSPSSPILRTRSLGKWCFLSHSATWGATSCSAKSRTLARKASCSAESSNGCDGVAMPDIFAALPKGPPGSSVESMEPVIQVRGLVKEFGSFRALDGLDLEVRAGEVHGFLGPNGSGKSTTIRVLLGLLRADSGDVRLLGGDPWRDVTSLHRRLAYVPGDVTLWPNLSGGE